MQILVKRWAGFIGSHVVEMGLQRHVRFTGVVNRRTVIAYLSVSDATFIPYARLLGLMSFSPLKLLA